MSAAHPIPRGLLRDRPAPGVVRVMPRPALFKLLRKSMAELERNPLRILEAGCGRKWPLGQISPNQHITGVDTDAAAVAARRAEHDDLQQVIIEDLRTVELPPESFDVVYCSYVLEHVKGAEKLMEKFVSCLRPGGVLILTIPDPWSVWGFLARVTPLWVHVMVKRLMGYRHAGKPGHGPYPTVYDPVVSREGMEDFCARHEMNALEVVGYASYERGGPLMRVLLPRLARLVSLLSGGRLQADYINLAFVIEKPARVERQRAASAAVANKRGFR